MRKKVRLMATNPLTGRVLASCFVEDNAKAIQEAKDGYRHAFKRVLDFKVESVSQQHYKTLRDVV
jgi:hypothetical protein